MPHYDVSVVLAHEAPMILIDTLNSYDENQAQCTVNIGPDSAFFDPRQGGVPAYVGIEYMAQSIAAFAGANDLDAGRDKQIGFLLGSRKYTMAQPVFANGQSLTIQVERLYQEESGLGVFECAILCQQEVLAQAKVNVFQPGVDQAQEG